MVSLALFLVVLLLLVLPLVSGWGSLLFLGFVSSLGVLSVLSELFLVPSGPLDISCQALLLPYLCDLWPESNDVLLLLGLMILSVGVGVLLMVSLCWFLVCFVLVGCVSSGGRPRLAVTVMAGPVFAWPGLLVCYVANLVLCHTCFGFFLYSLSSCPPCWCLGRRFLLLQADKSSGWPSLSMFPQDARAPLGLWLLEAL